MVRSKWMTGGMLALSIAVVSPALAIFVRMWEPVPLARLIANAEKAVKEKPKDPQALYILGRLHSLGFVRGEKPINYNEKAGDAPGFPPYETIRQKPDAAAKPTPEALAHLRESVRLYNEAAQLAPKNGLYWLGLGWMLLQGVPYASHADWPLGKPGEKKPRTHWVRSAAEALWKAYNLNEKDDLAKPSTGLNADWSISLEAGQSLLEILNKDLAGDLDVNADKERIKKTVMALQAKPRVVTPLIFPTAPASPISSTRGGA
jgi:hypothetical protein